MPSCIIAMTSSSSILSNASESLLCPIWCGSLGLPSLEAALRHDALESRELLELEESLVIPDRDPSNDDPEHVDEVCPALQSLMKDILDAQFGELCRRKTFMNSINTRRCHAQPFAYPQRCIDAVTVFVSPFERSSNCSMTSPEHLLALRRSHQDVADDLSEMIRKFVFAVPKAGAQSPIMDVNEVHHEIRREQILSDTLLVPLQEYLKPFRQAHARLSSFFPDKNLIQYDAGKLQVLAELLRERKKGGHKVLIFTQMQKMLDILEAFLNINGHTYLRLDGSTSVDRRQVG
jgi:SNF2 family DNA or RNA helicase